MGLKVTIEDPSLVDDFLSNVKSQRSSGRGPLADSWIISSHLKEMSEKLFDLSINDSKITGIHLFINGDFAIVSGANFSDSKTLKNLSGKTFASDSHSGRVSFQFGNVVEEFKMPVTWVSKKTVSLTFFLNCVVFEIKKVTKDAPDFYQEMTQNLELLKSLGRPILPNGEPALDCHMMDFAMEIPGKPKNLKTNIAKIFTSFL